MCCIRFKEKAAAAAEEELMKTTRQEIAWFTRLDAERNIKVLRNAVRIYSLSVNDYEVSLTSQCCMGTVSRVGYLLGDCQSYGSLPPCA